MSLLTGSRGMLGKRVEYQPEFSATLFVATRRHDDDAMLDTLMRQWLMLRMIPRRPRHIDAPLIHKLLSAQGIDVSLRTIQRDLNNLAGVFPLEFDSARPQGWCWRAGAAQFEVPGMGPHAALTFSLAEIHMRDLLPTATIEHMTPWFETAHAVMGSQASSLCRWPEKLRVVSTSPTKVAAKINPDVQATVYDALLDDRQLELTYRAITTEKAPKTYPVHPLALVVSPPVVYLACVARDYTEPRFLAMHRIERAMLLDAPTKRPKGFDIDDMIAREFGIRLAAKPLNLTIKVRGLLRRYLQETPLAPGQRMRALDDEWSEVSARVADTIMLRNWLRSLGPDAVVMAPPWLRNAMRDEIGRLRTLYQTRAEVTRP